MTVEMYGGEMIRARSLKEAKAYAKRWGNLMVSSGKLDRRFPQEYGDKIYWFKKKKRKYGKKIDKVGIYKGEKVRVSDKIGGRYYVFIPNKQIWVWVPVRKVKLK